MINRSLPYFFEDRTGLYTDSDYDDIYDRLFFRVGRPKPTESTLTIYNTGRRSSSRRESRPISMQRTPGIVLEFGAHGALGKVTFVETGISMPMGQYLRKTSMFGGSLSRKFRASDGQEYRWMYRNSSEHEWCCMDCNECIVAHYDLKPPDKPVFSMSGNILTIYEAYVGLAVEILASLTIMRHIEAQKL